MPLPNFGPPIPGVTKSDSPVTGPDLVEKLAALTSGRQPTPAQSSGDKVAMAVQLLREAGSQDPRLAPILQAALQTLTTGQAAGPGAPPPAPMQGPGPQAMGMAGAGGGPEGGALGQLSAMMSGG